MDRYSTEVDSLRKACACLIDTYFDPDLTVEHAVRLKQAIGDTMHAMACLRGKGEEEEKAVRPLAEDEATPASRVKIIRLGEVIDPPRDAPPLPRAEEEKEVPF